MFKKIIACICLCGAVLLSGCTIPSYSSASKQTATSKADEVIFKRSFDEMNEYIRKIVSKRLTPRYEKYLEMGYMDSPDDSFEFNWNRMLNDMLLGMEQPKESDFGYALKDINGDGINELFFIRSDNTVLSMFAMFLENTTMLDAFYSARKCILLDDGNILTITQEGDDYITYNIRNLPHKRGKLEEIMVVGKQGNEYFKTVEGKKTPITKDEFDQVIKDFPDNNDGKFNFLPFAK